MDIESKKVEDYLNSVCYSVDPNYVPSDFALEFITFIKLVNGAEGEENKSPVLHFNMLDNVIDGDRTANMCHRGSAKALSVDTRVLTDKGNKTIADLAIGDLVYSRNGNLTPITHKSEVFNKPMYEIILTDGRKLKVSEDHINIVQKRRTGLRSLGGYAEKELTTSELINLGVTYPKPISERNPTGKESKWFVPTASAIDIDFQALPLDPYTVGCVLGDGSINKETGFTRMHTHIDDLDHFITTIPYLTSTVRADNRRPDTVRFSIKGIGPLVKQFIGTENVYGKRVPQELLWAGNSQRLAVLQGLMDTDGTIDVHGNCSFTSVSEGLANDVIWLVRSLGGEAKVTQNLWAGFNSFRVYIRLNVCPFLLQRKADRWKPNVIGRAGIVDITRIQDCESQCIAVEDSTHSFLAESFFVTHNTTLLAEYLFLYLGVYGELPGFGKIQLALYVSDSIENGVKNLRKNLEHRYDKSEFLQYYIPFIKFTDIRWEFKNRDGHTFIVKGYGAKALALDTKLYTLNGETTIGDCQVGDKIFGADGQLTAITAKSEVFNKPMYELLLGDGRTLKVSEDHFNPVIINTNPNNTVRWEEKVLTTKELLEEELIHTKKGNLNHAGVSSKHLVFVKNIKPIEYLPADLPIDPYTLGVVLGDGRIRKECGSVELTAHKDEFEFYYTQIPYTFGKKRLDPRSNAATQSIRGLGKLLVAMDLNVRGEMKFIPTEYFYGSIQQRVSIVQGLMDTDGTCSTSGRASFTSSSYQLCDDLACMVRSLGGTVMDIQKHSSAEAYRIELWMEMNPFRLPRKAERFVSKIKNVPIVNIRSIAVEPSQCIAVDNEERQFIANCYFRTHNTGVRGAKELGVRPTLAVLDDLVSDEDARSATVIASIEDTVYKAVTYALHPTKNKIIWSGTPFNAKDPLYKAIESGAWKVNVFPVCEEFPCSEKDFKGSWPERFTYASVKAQYEIALKAGKIDGFNQEMMLRIMSDEDRLISDSDIQWYSRPTLMQNIGKFNFYVTTDFATSAKTAADFSVISVWALNHNGDWYWVDGICRKQTMEKNINDLFRLCQQYKPMSVGVEISGQQGGFIPWINEQMMARNAYFTLASEGNRGQPGIRPNTDKMTRFQLVVPWFKLHKMHFPLEMKNSPEMAQCMDELTNMSAKGTKSKHDDFTDTISMLAFMGSFKPSAEVDAVWNGQTDIWEFEEEHFDDRRSSYIV